MGKKVIKEKEKLSFEEECLMWTSYRYCIGRKTYVSSMAYYIAKKYYPLLNDNRMIFTSEDIRREITDHFNWLPFHFHYDGSVSSKERKPYEDCVEFLMNEVIKNMDSREEIQPVLLKIKDVEVYHETYKDGEPHKYRVTYNEDVNVRNYISDSDINDYQCWAALAALFDKEHYKKLHVKLPQGEEKDVICFETWIEDTKPIDDKPGYCKMWPWHWKRVFVDVENFVKNGEHCGYIIPEYITSVEDYNATVEKD